MSAPTGERALKEARYEYQRRRYLPSVIAATRMKLLALEREASRLGVPFTEEEVWRLRRAAENGDKIAEQRIKHWRGVLL